MSFSFSQGSGLLFHEVPLLSDLTYQASVSKSLNAFRFRFHLTSFSFSFLSIVCFSFLFSVFFLRLCLSVTVYYLKT